MAYIPRSIRQDIVCDNVAPLGDTKQVSFFVKANFYNYSDEKSLIYVDFTLSTKSSEIIFLGDWKCRINYWLIEHGNITINVGFEFFKDGFRYAQALAQSFVLQKYGLSNVLPNPSDEELRALFQNILTNQN